MKKQKQSGFVLVLIIVFISLFGLLMIAMSGMSKTMMYESIDAKLQVANKNLVSSALAWAKQNIKNMSLNQEPLTVQLDVSDLEVSQATCQITFYKLDDDTDIEVEIDTTCNSGRHHLKRKARFILED